MNFLHSWAFAFIIGCFVGGAIGFIGACILAVAGRASRVEEFRDIKFKKALDEQSRNRINELL